METVNEINERFAERTHARYRELFDRDAPEPITYIRAAGGGSQPTQNLIWGGDDDEVQLDFTVNGLKDPPAVEVSFTLPGEDGYVEVVLEGDPANPEDMPAIVAAYAALLSDEDLVERCARSIRLVCNSG